MHSTAGLYRVAPIAGAVQCLLRSHCARVGGPLVIGRPTCILTGDCLRTHALQQTEIVGATLLSTSSRMRARARARVCAPSDRCYALESSIVDQEDSFADSCKFGEIDSASVHRRAIGHRK